jgi:DNA-binding transcriptional LysR family regulator
MVDVPGHSPDLPGALPGCGRHADRAPSGAATTGTGSRGYLDVGFFTLDERGRGLEGERIALDPLVAALPDTHPLARRSRVSLASLAGEPWVLFPRDLRTRYVELVLECCGASGFVPRVVQEASQMQTLAGLVSAGVGVTLLPGAIASASRAGVAFRPLRAGTPKLPIHLVWRAGDLSSTAVRFVAVAREVAHSARGR